MHSHERLLVQSVSVFGCSAEASGEADQSTGLLVRGGAYLIDGEAWHRHGRQHSRSHQQHL